MLVLQAALAAERAGVALPCPATSIRIFFSEEQEYTTEDILQGATVLLTWAHSAHLLPHL